jgi:hypothetical protein
MNSKSLYSKLALLGGALFRPFFLIILVLYFRSCFSKFNLIYFELSSLEYLIFMFARGVTKAISI